MMKAYPEYKESGIEWLGDVPSHWLLSKNKFLAKFTKGKNPSELHDDKAPNLYAYLAMDFLRGRNDSPKYAHLDKSSYLVKDGQNLIIWDGSNAGEFVIGKEGILSSTMAAGELSEKVTAKFYKYLTTLIEKEMRRLTIGMGIPHVDGSELNNLYLPLPESFQEQEKIADYLDVEVGRVDNLIAEKENFIKLLSEKRQALISHVVTKGLNPNVLMKDSGVEWIGEIPEHWDVTLLKYQTSKIGSGKTPSGGAEAYQEQGIKFLRSQNIYNDGLRLDDVVYISDEIHYEMRGSKVLANDVLLNITGGSIGRTCLVPIDIGEANVNQHVCIIRSKDESFSELLSLIMASTLVSEQVDYLQTGAGREGLNFVEIGQFKIPFPPKSEWQQIVDYLLLSESKIQCLLEETNKSIELLKERRIALISAAVTGKIDVREEV